MVCRKCNSTRVKFWNGWELCDNCGYRYHTETKISPDDIICDKCERRNHCILYYEGGLTICADFKGV